MKIIKCLLAVIGLSLAFAAFANPSQPKTVKPAVVTSHHTERTKKLDLNKADAKQIAEAINGIGPKRAAAIVEFRQKNGAFKTFADLTHVKGISGTFVQKNLQQLEKVFVLG